MIALNCGNVIVNDSDVQICDLQNSCLNAGDTIKIPVSVCYMPCPLGGIKAILKDGNAIVMDGDFSTLTGTIIVSDTCSINNITCSVVSVTYNSGTNTSTIYTNGGFQDCPGSFCPGPECGILSKPVCPDAAAVLTVTNTTLGQEVYTHTYEGEVDTYYEFLIPSHGVYSVSLVASQCIGTDCEDTKTCEYTFQACPFYQLKKEGCHEYCLYDTNPFSKTNYVTVEGVNGYSETYTFETPYQDHVCFTTPSDGVYTAKVSYSGYGDCTGTCLTQNPNFTTDLSWWCSYIGYDTNPYTGGVSYCSGNYPSFIWDNGHALYNQAYNGTRGAVIQQSCLTIGKTYCLSFKVTNLNTAVAEVYDTTTIQVYAGDTLITSTQMPELSFQDNTLTTHDIFIPAITCTNATHPLNNWLSIQIINGGTAHPLSVVYIDDVCVREVQQVPQLEESYTNVIYDLCDMAACIKKLILDLFCNEEDPCCNDCDPAKQKAKELYRNELNKLNALYTTFSMMIAKEQTDNLGVFSMDSCREMNITEIQNVFEKINAITKRCGDCDGNSDITTPSSGCNGC